MGASVGVGVGASVGAVVIVMHAGCPGWFWYFPLGHAVQLVAPDVG